ncbi:MAG: GIY-YIG nuclease family protein [Pseudomonadota bacterium]
MLKTFYIYILASKKNGFLYTGLTSELPKRIWEHKNEVVEGHTKKYKIKRLVHYEVFEDFEAAVKREKQLKKWRRQWKIDLIEKANPDWNELYDEICK